MKFSLAVGILSQTLPVVSETAVSAWLDSKRQGDGQSLAGKDRLSAILASGRSRRGRFQQGHTANHSGRRINRPKQRSRQLVNAPSAADAAAASEMGKVQVCDPTVSDPDVGFLSCGPDAECTPHVRSVLGGFCVQIDSPSSSASASRHDDLNRMSKAGSGKLKNLSSQSLDGHFCDPFSTDPDIGVLSCGKGRQCQPNTTSPLGGECKAVGSGPSLILLGTKSSGVEGVECVPTEADVDGLRRCGTGQICAESMESKMGGFCATPTDARHLQWDNDVVLCDSQFYANYDCDCSAFDTSTQSGAIACLSGSTCVGSYYYGCYDTCRTHTTKYVFGNKELRSIEQCYEFIAGDDATTSSAVCFMFPSNYTSCGVVVDGQACSSCAISDSSFSDFGFDCTNAADGFAGDSFTSLPIIQACYLPVDGVDCNLCGSNVSFIPSGDDTPISLDGFGDLFTCSGLSSANSYNQLSAGKCPEAAVVATADCCVYQCDICGYGRILRESTASDPIAVTGFGQTTCYDVHYAGYVDYSIPEENCPALREAIGDSCCVDYYKSVYCKVCDYGNFIPSTLDSTFVTVEGRGDYTCLDIDSAAYGDRTETTSSSTLDVNCTVLQDAGATTCCRPYAESCHVCGLGNFISYTNHEVAFTADPTMGTMSCYDIYYGSYMGGTIAGETCSLVQQLGAKSCCETLTGYNQCLVCGTAGIAFPGANITSVEGESTVSCKWVGYYAETGYFDETECDYLTSLAGASCCAPTTNSPTTLPPRTEASEPTVSPMMASDPPESTSSTTDGANSAGASSAGSSGTGSPLPTPVAGILVLTGAGCLAFMASNS